MKMLSLSQLQEDLKNKFGLQIPQNVITTILKRVKKREYIFLDKGLYKRNPKKLITLNFEEVQQKVIAKHETLLADLRSYCLERFNINWSDKEAEDALLSFLDDYQLVVVDATIHKTIIPEPIKPKTKTKFILGEFVKHLEQSHSSLLNDLETIVKGNLLANAIFLPDPYQANRKFRKTEIYFDTTFLIYALGYAGKTRSAPCRELLELLYETGANLRCFRHTLEEIRGALDSCGNQLSKSPSKYIYGPGIPSFEYFLSKGYTTTDVQILINRLESDLNSLRIRIVDKPSYTAHLVIDEEELKNSLEKKLNYSNPRALERDVDSISAINRLRFGQEYYFVEESGALFLTTNTNLAQVVAEFYYRDANPNAVPPCLTDYSLTNLLWLKTPTKAPDLPRKRVIADCFASTQPNYDLWAKYLDEIQKLEKDKTITGDDYYLLRYSMDAKSYLMELTLGEEEAFTQGTVPEILEHIQAKIRSALESQLEVEKLKTEGFSVREQERLSNIEARSEKISRVIGLIIRAILIAVLLVTTLTTFPWELPSITISFGRYLLPIFWVILLILSVDNLWRGKALEIYIREFEVNLAKWIGRWLIALTE